MQCWKENTYIYNDKKLITTKISEPAIDLFSAYLRGLFLMRSRIMKYLAVLLVVFAAYGHARREGFQPGSAFGSDTADAQAAGALDQRCGRWQKYVIDVSSSVAPTKPTNKPWQYAVRIGSLLHMTSVRAFTSFANRTIISPGGVYKEAIHIMRLTEQILAQAGCTWNDVHDVLALTAAGPKEFTTIDQAFVDFCSTHGCSQFPWSGHLRAGGPFQDGATVEITVQASNCAWPGIAKDCLRVDG